MNHKATLKDILETSIEVRNLVKRLNLTPLNDTHINMLLDALPTLLDIVEEEKKENLKYKTTLKRKNNKLYRVVEISPQARAEDNLISQSINPIVFDKELIEFDANRHEIWNCFKTQIKEIPYVLQKGLYLYGGYGIGKTFILKKAVEKILKYGSKVAFLNVSQFQAFVYNCMDAKNSDFKSHIKQFSEVPYLFLDDIGGESISAYFRDTILFGILNTRMEHKRVTFFSSNYSLEELLIYESKTNKKAFPDLKQAERLLERIKATTIAKKMLGKNRRY